MMKASTQSPIKLKDVQIRLGMMVFEARREVGTRKRTWKMKLEDKNGVKRENTQV